MKKERTDDCLNNFNNMGKEKIIGELKNYLELSVVDKDEIVRLFTKAINQTREETIREVEEMLSKIVLKDLSGKWSEEVIDFSTSIVDATVLKIKQSLKSLINK